MMRYLRASVAVAFIVGLLAPASQVLACDYDRCPETGLENGGAEVRDSYTGDAVEELVVGSAEAAASYAWRITRLCVLAEERDGPCSPSDFRPCPEQPGRVSQFMVVQRRALVRPDGTAVV